MMKHLLTILASAVVTGFSFARSPAATQDRVASYVSNQVSTIAASLKTESTAEMDRFSVVENGTNVTVAIEKPTVFALVLRDCSAGFAAAGFTNGLTFVWQDNGYYSSGGPGITATATNLVLSTGIAYSREIDGETWFAYGDMMLGRVCYTYVQPSVAAAILGK